MAHFLRDQLVTNVSITEENVRQICLVFADRARMLNDKPIGIDENKDEALLYYIIRFDNKGYRVFFVRTSTCLSNRQYHNTWQALMILKNMSCLCKQYR